MLPKSILEAPKSTPEALKSTPEAPEDPKHGPRACFCDFRGTPGALLGGVLEQKSVQNVKNRMGGIANLL